MERSEIINKLAGCVAQKLNCEMADLNMSETSDLFNDIGLDSLDFVEIVMECEKVFSIVLDDNKLDGVRTVSKLVDLIEEEIKRKEPVLEGELKSIKAHFIVESHDGKEWKAKAVPLCDKITTPEKTFWRAIHPTSGKTIGHWLGKDLFPILDITSVQTYDRNHLRGFSTFEHLGFGSAESILGSLGMSMAFITYLEENGNIGFKICRKVVEVYVDTTKEVLIKTKCSDKWESVQEALKAFGMLYYKSETFRALIK